jgi:hypothetical protein
MKIQIEGIPKQDRIAFKEYILNAINGKGNVYFTLNIAIIETKEAYIITEKTLQEKNQTKKTIYQAIKDFRLYQFNK